MGKLGRPALLVLMLCCVSVGYGGESSDCQQVEWKSKTTSSPRLVFTPKSDQVVVRFKSPFDMAAIDNGLGRLSMVPVNTGITQGIGKTRLDCLCWSQAGTRGRTSEFPVATPPSFVSSA
jgi:hypothetical protein